MIDPHVQACLSVVDGTLKSSKIPYAVVGARVLELRQDELGLTPKFGTTRDVDLVILVSSMDEFEVAKALLSKEGFKQERADHELRSPKHGSIDIVPCGKPIAPDGRVQWRVAKGFLNVLGLEEALLMATAVPVGALSIPVITIPAFVMVKIQAYLDNRSKMFDDLDDIHFCLEHYLEDDPEARRYEVKDLPGGEETDYPSAGAWLIGAEIAKIASARVKEASLKFFASASDPYSREVDRLCQRDPDGDVRAGVARLFATAKAGLEAQRSA